jgi:hypothetical protein
MKDRILLLIAAMTMSALAWLFWHFARGNAIGILMSFLLVVLTADNFLLRRELRNTKKAVTQIK